MGRCYSCMKEYSDAYEVCPHCGYVRNSQGEGMYYLPEGTVLVNRYEVGVQINAGGFGIIYKAWDQTLKKMVAVKEYYPGGTVARTPGTSGVLVYSEKKKEEFEKGKARFLIEARTVAKFNTHPNITNVYDFFEENNTAYMVMDYMDGVSYKDYINSHNGVVDVKTAVRVALSVLDVLREVHKKKIIHRDINPSNIFICNNGIVKLIDFGAARIEDTEMTMVLTAHFAPPEQYQSNSKQGPCTDIYALGATLYYSVTGIKPEEAINRVLEDHLKEPREINPEIPEYINNAIMRAMAVKEELRFQNAAQFRDSIKASGNVLKVEEIIRRKKKQRVIGVLAVFLVLAVTLGVCVSVMNQRREKAVLTAAELEAWIFADIGQEPSEAEEEFLEMISGFREDYPQVTVQVTAFEREEYDKRLKEAAAEDSLPDVFDSTNLDYEYYDRLDSLEEACELIETSQFFFLDNYEEYFPGKKQIPLCFQAPVLYASSINADLSIPASFVSCEDLKNQGKYDYSVNPKDFELYETITGEDCITWFKKLADEQKKDFLTDGYDMFTEQEVSYYLSDTSDYRRLIDDIPGQFQVILVTEGVRKGRFDRLFSVALNKPEKQRRAAKRLVYYLLSENAQDVLCVQNTAGLPLNKRMCGEYAGVNQQDFSDIERGIPDLVLEGEKQILSYKEYMKKWEK